LKATSFSGRVVAIDRIVKPAVDCEMWRRVARVDVVDERSIPERVRRAAERMRFRKCRYVGLGRIRGIRSRRGVPSKTCQL
jgi:hypothetical protein